MILDLKKLVNKYNLKINGVIHIGAHLGQEYNLYKELNIGDMAFFEPQEKIFKELSNIIPESKHIKLFNMALGNETGSIKMYIDSYKQQSSSILEPKKHLSQYPHIQFHNEQNVLIDRLDNIIKSKSYNFISMDVQGYELEVLKGSNQILHNIDYIEYI